jgi:hypothetical protein
MTETTLNANYRRYALAITFVSMIIVYFLWVNPMGWGIISLIMTPIRLFVTYVHEASHSLATIISGGQVVGFVVFPDGSGVATSRGGSMALIAPAGYLGAAFFGSLLFLIVNRLPKYMNGISFILGFAMMIFTLLFARPDDSGLPLAMFLGVGFGIFMIVMGAKLPVLATTLVLNVLSIVTALNAVGDVSILITQPGTSLGMLSNDASNFSQRVMPFLPTNVVALIWSAMSVAMFAFALYWGVWKPLHQEINTTYESMVNK